MTLRVSADAGSRASDVNKHRGVLLFSPRSFIFFLFTSASLRAEGELMVEGTIHHQTLEIGEVPTRMPRSDSEPPEFHD